MACGQSKAWTVPSDLISDKQLASKVQFIPRPNKVIKMFVTETQWGMLGGKKEKKKAEMTLRALPVSGQGYSAITVISDK